MDKCLAILGRHLYIIDFFVLCNCQQHIFSLRNRLAAYGFGNRNDVIWDTCKRCMLFGWPTMCPDYREVRTMGVRIIKVVLSSKIAAVNSYACLLLRDVVVESNYLDCF